MKETEVHKDCNARRRKKSEKERRIPLVSDTYLDPYKRQYRRQSTDIHKEIPIGGYQRMRLDERTLSRIRQCGHGDRQLYTQL
jgi:hypothetical protein